MTGILDRIKNTTVADLENVSGDFSDVAPEVYRPRVPKDMHRIVKGATDLQRPNIPNVNAGMVRTDGSGTMDTRPFKGRPTDRQLNFMQSLMFELKGLDEALYNEGVKYMENMNAHNAWDASRDGNASRWITSLKAKIAELKTRPVEVKVAPSGDEDLFTDVPDGRYAVEDSGPGDWIFVKVSTGRKGGAYEGRRIVKVQASDDLHPVRNSGRCKAILNTIRVVTPPVAMARYGQHIGACGRCGRTLTDKVSRDLGIGPDCRGKLGM